MNSKFLSILSTYIHKEPRISFFADIVKKTKNRNAQFSPNQKDFCYLIKFIYIQSATSNSRNPVDINTLMNINLLYLLNTIGRLIHKINRD